MQVNTWALWLMLGWITLIIIFFIAMLIKYTFKDWSVEKPNPYEKETLGLPRGMMRSILTLSILFVVMILEVNSLGFKTELVGGEVFVPEDRYAQMMTAFQMMIAFYFGSKVVHHVTSAEKSARELELKVENSLGEFNDPKALG